MLRLFVGARLSRAGRLGFAEAAICADNVAVEVMNATQALDFHAPLQPGPAVAAAVREVRAVVPPLDADRIMTGDLAAVRSLLVSGRLRDAVQQVTGTLR